MIDEQKLADRIENLGSGLVSVGLLAISSQTAWPVPGFVLPQGLITGSFYTAWAGVAIRIMAKPIAGLFCIWANRNEPKTTQQKENS